MTHILPTLPLLPLRMQLLRPVRLLEPLQALPLHPVPNGPWMNWQSGYVRVTIHSNELERPMPAISMFYGIIIYLYFFDDDRHGTPHIHARYQGQQASLSITDGSLLAGEIPANKLRLVQAWIEIHREALSANWDLVIQGEPPFAIEPLR
jgi:hypothetical protein